MKFDRVSESHPEGSSTENLRTGELYLKAEELNCDMIIADDYTLLLDIDNGDMGLQDFKALYYTAVSNGILPGNGYETWPSRSKGWHVRITLTTPLCVEERIGLQSMLGSDRIRDLLSLARIRNNIENPIVLFRPKIQQ